MTPRNIDIHGRIERRLGERLSKVELLAVEPTGADRLRVVIDAPGGVDLALCERVTGELFDLLADYSLEVSSPGPERPLTKPDHFRRFIGRRARVRTREPLGRSADRSPIGRAPNPGVHRRRSFTGELVGATDDDVTLAAEGGVVSIRYSEIKASNLTNDAGEGPAQAGERRQG